MFGFFANQKQTPTDHLVLNILRAQLSQSEENTVEFLFSYVFSRECTGIVFGLPVSCISLVTGAPEKVLDYRNQHSAFLFSPVKIEKCIELVVQLKGVRSQCVLVECLNTILNGYKSNVVIDTATLTPAFDERFLSALARHIKVPMVTMSIP